MDTNSNFGSQRSGEGNPLPLPADLIEAAASVDRLAAHERSLAGASLQDRIFMATRAAIAQGVPADVADRSAALYDLGALDSLDARVRGSWFRVDSTTDEESL